MNARNYLTKLPRSTSLANTMLRDYYRYCNDAVGKKPVVWVDVNFTTFMLWGMDVVPVIPQIHAAFQAQRKKVKRMMHELETKYEIPHSICGEVKGLIGTAIYQSDVAFELPKPDVLVATNAACIISSKGLKYVADHFGKELLFADFPYGYSEITPRMIDYATAQYTAIFKRIEKLTGRQFTLEKARECSENGILMYKLWSDICQLNTAVPTPVDALDLFLFSSIINLVPCDERIFHLLITLYNEIYEKILRNKSAPHNEKFRVLWHYLPIYSRKKFFQNIFDENNISLATGSFFPIPEGWSNEAWNAPMQYPASMAKVDDMRKALRASGDLDLDYDGLMRMLAESLLQMEVNRNIQHRQSVITRLVKDFKIDGVIMHCDRSCRTQSLPQYKIKDYLTNDLKLPVLLFDADSMDDRFFAPSQVTTRLEAFLEMLRGRKKG